MSSDEPLPGAHPLLRVEDLRTHFYTRSGRIPAVEAVSFELGEGESLG
ncbi:MAG: methionine ABC transporter ATP-binding protein, partial [Acidobacteria bacterium]|nr:methionine ABC transporter ATP-binding protein [Acidobacteriota bacterium]